MRESPGQAMDLTGQRYGRLLVIAHAGRRNAGKHYWLCRCDCGHEKAIAAGSLRQGRTRSCGCYSQEVRLASTINLKHGGTNTATFSAWKSMRARCRTNKPEFKDYAGRGIKVCERWGSFENFLADMGERPEGMTLDRWPDVNGNYEPGNCRWASYSEQNRNKRNNVRLTYQGRTLCVSEWAEVLGIPAGRVRRRLSLGWDAERALATPKIGNRYA